MDELNKPLPYRISDGTKAGANWDCLIQNQEASLEGGGGYPGLAGEGRLGSGTELAFCLARAHHALLPAALPGAPPGRARPGDLSLECALRRKLGGGDGGGRGEAGEGLLLLLTASHAQLGVFGERGRLKRRGGRQTPSYLTHDVSRGCRGGGSRAAPSLYLGAVGEQSRAASVRLRQAPPPL